MAITHVTILIGCLDDRSLLRFPSDGGEFHGYTVPLAGEPDAKFIKDKTCQSIGIQGDVEILQMIDHPLKKHGTDYSYLIAVRVPKDLINASEEWPTLPVILRQMPSGSNRLVYNKAFQVFAGANEHSYDALEIDEEVRKRLQELAKDDKIH